MNEGSRFHNDQSKFLHLLNPPLKRLSEPGDTRPLVLAPQWLCFIRVLDRPVEIDSFVVIDFPGRYVPSEPLVAWMKELDDRLDDSGHTTLGSRSDRHWDEECDTI